MTGIPLLVTCLAVGVVAARVLAQPARLARGISWWVLRIALPALVLTLLPRLEFERSLWFLIAAMWLVFVGGWALAAVAGARLGWSRARIGAVALTAGLGNTAFTGYPLIEALRGSQALPYAAVADQLGCFIALSTGGVILASWYARERALPGALIRHVVLFPPFLACIAGFIAGQLGGWPAWLDQLLRIIGATLSPLALLAIGLQLRWRIDATQLRAVSLGLGWKLLAAPLLVWLLGIAAGAEGLLLTVGVLQAAMGPMVSATILAEERGLDAAVGHAMLAAGVIASLVSVPLIDTLL
ncbi:MAG TPA: AEC family transporter [Steroidobacteraceae bacterium]|nr:AEC family transporter [Steroidobacteraceae bacterium]HNS27404.1 AEC family transporter [Steroidobacteraceae bacterium]